MLRKDNLRYNTGSNNWEESFWFNLAKTISEKSLGEMDLYDFWFLSVFYRSLGFENGVANRVIFEQLFASDKAITPSDVGHLNISQEQFYTIQLWVYEVFIQTRLLEMSDLVRRVLEINKIIDVERFNELIGMVRNGVVFQEYDAGGHNQVSTIHLPSEVKEELRLYLKDLIKNRRFETYLLALLRRNPDYENLRPVISNHIAWIRGSI